MSATRAAIYPIKLARKSVTAYLDVCSENDSKISKVNNYIVIVKLRQILIDPTNSSMESRLNASFFSFILQVSETVDKEVQILLWKWKSSRFYPKIQINWYVF